MLQKGHLNIGGTPTTASGLAEASYNLQINGHLADHECSLQMKKQEGISQNRIGREKCIKYCVKILVLMKKV
ncbi:hypothetical protein C0J52_06615 [Blattella germanica]|nr:hypothetical protein C0J52_06615 [Blattella germanica]